MRRRVLRALRDGPPRQEIQLRPREAHIHTYAPHAVPHRRDVLQHHLPMDSRAIYRVIELADGFRGRISTTQVYSALDVLDGWMIVFAIITLNFAHPGFLLPAQKPADEEKVGSQSQSVEMLDRE